MAFLCSIRVSMRKTWTGRAMFFTLCSPRSAKPIGSFSATCSRTVALTQIRPGSARASKSRRNVDAVAKNIVALYDHVAHVDADAKADAATFIDVRIAALNSLLDDDGAAHRIDDRRELDEKAIARRLEDAALMLSDQRIDELPCGGPSARRASLPRRCP